MISLGWWRVLSIPFLVLQVLQREDYFIRLSDSDENFILLTNLILEVNEEWFCGDPSVITLSRTIYASAEVHSYTAALPIGL